MKRHKSIRHMSPTRQEEPSYEKKMELMTMAQEFTCQLSLFSVAVMHAAPNLYSVLVFDEHNQILGTGVAFIK